MATSLLTGRHPKVESDLRTLYAKAGNRDNQETVVRRFWTALFEDEDRYDTALHTVAEQAPDHQRQRVDLVVYTIQQDKEIPLLYVEFKKASTSHPQQDHEQVTNYYWSLLDAYSRIRDIRALLCYGTETRGWTVTRHGNIHPNFQTGWVDADHDMLNSRRPAPVIHSKITNKSPTTAGACSTSILAYVTFGPCFVTAQKQGDGQ